MKIWPFALLFIPALAWSGEQDQASAPTPTDDTEPPINWVDDSHTYATNQAQALTEWMDRFFGDPEWNIEQAESWLRLESVFEWDQDDGNDAKLRLRGKVQLPRLSRRLNLVFAGEDGEELDEEERKQEDTVGLQYNVGEGARSRFDVTLGFASGSLRPGVRYRAEDKLSEVSNYRFTQRVQYESDEGVFSTTQLDLNRALDANSLLRWSNKALWGEETLGVEWRTRLSLRHRLFEETRRPMALSYFGAIKGVTRPEQWIKNYRLGLLVRRQIYRDFLFMEVEPAINFRQRLYEDDREAAWSLVVRFEIALEKDLRRMRKEPEDEMRPVSEEELRERAASEAQAMAPDSAAPDPAPQ